MITLFVIEPVLSILLANFKSPPEITSSCDDRPGDNDYILGIDMDVRMMKRTRENHRYYQIEIKGAQSLNWTHWFEEMTLIENGQRTVVRGHLEDRMALEELIHQIYSLKMNLLSVICLSEN